MREIEFRAWDLDEKTWISNSVTISAQFRIFQMFIDDNQKFHCFPRAKENIIIQQYTGLKDKNGVKIFEGDVVKWGSNSSEGFFLREVKWDFERLTYIIIDLVDGQYGKGMDFLSESGDNGIRWCEIVGNIFENPDLIK